MTNSNLIGLRRLRHKCMGSPPLPAFRRYSASHLCDIVYGLQPMTTELAEVIRTLRRDYNVSYERLGFYLCESNPDAGASFGLGKALTDFAANHLNDRDRAWV
jgi:hypothetical protein